MQSLDDMMNNTKTSNNTRGKELTYTDVLRDSYRHAGNNICLGLDPQWQKLPASYRKLRQFGKAGSQPDCAAIQGFLEISLDSLQTQGLCPAAFKPNLGYFQALDRPLIAERTEAQKPEPGSAHSTEYAFAGSRLLAWLYHYLSRNFPGIPIILDFKKGDIARSSANYAEEGFALWRSDALTVNPYMGPDSLAPFGKTLNEHLSRATHNDESCSLSCALPYGNGGVYSLLRTSNPGARALQNLAISPTNSLSTGQTLYQSLAQSLLRWREEQQIPGLGAVVGATSPKELEQLANFFAKQDFPLLIPGIGKQGGSYSEVQTTLKQAGYPLELARINASSALLQGWGQNEAPTDWPRLICQKMEELLQYK